MFYSTFDIIVDNHVVDILKDLVLAVVVLHIILSASCAPTTVRY